MVPRPLNDELVFVNVHDQTEKIELESLVRKVGGTPQRDGLFATMIIVKLSADISTQELYNLNHPPLLPKYLSALASRFQRIGYSASLKAQYDALLQRYVAGDAPIEPPIQSSPLHQLKRATESPNLHDSTINEQDTEGGVSVNSDGGEIGSVRNQHQGGETLASLGIGGEEADLTTCNDACHDSRMDATASCAHHVSGQANGTNINDMVPQYYMAM